MAVTIKLNYGAVGALLRSAEMQAALRPAAEGVLSRAQDLAPVDLEADDPGEYKASLQIIDEHASDRARLIVGSTVPYAQQVEMNHGVLGKAL